MPEFVPAHPLQVALVLLLAFLIGFEREERRQAEGRMMFGGVRTFPLIGLVSYALALVSGTDLLAWTMGFAVVGGFMLLSYQRKLVAVQDAGITSEMSGLATYLMAGLVYQDQYWMAATIAVVSVLLLDLKKALEGLTRYVEAGEVAAVAQFLVLTVVILPIVPNRDFTRFAINPFRTWLVVVAASGLSFCSYVVQRLLRGRGGVMVSALLGGAYSSTLTTVVLARDARRRARPNLLAGGILAASGVMYARFLVLIALFNIGLALALLPGFAIGAAAGVVGGWLLASRGERSESPDRSPQPKVNPLELTTALIFTAVFVALMVLTTLARESLGRGGLYALAGIVGVANIDPFVLSVIQPHAVTLPLHVAATAVIIAAASNNVIKAVYARSFADRVTGRRAAVSLVGLAAVGLVGLFWV
jgi:uncharacterized membrane protein (DUF4010 family)